MPTLTKTTVFEHDHLKAKFTCTCGKEQTANFSRNESHTCKACGRKHLPTLRLITHEKAAA